MENIARKPVFRQNPVQLWTNLGVVCAGILCIGLVSNVAAQTNPTPSFKFKRQMTLPTQPVSPPPAPSPHGGSVVRERNLNATSPAGAGFVLRGVLVNSQLLEAATLDEFIERLPAVGPKRPDRSNARGDVEESTETAPEGGRTRSYGVTRQRFSLATTPDQIVTFEPVAGFWLGSILEDRGLRSGLGSQREIPIPSTTRAGFVISVNNLAVPSGSQRIENPSMSSVNSAIATMIQGARNVDYSSSTSTKIVDNYDANQTALALGLDAAYMGARVKAALDTNSSASRQAVSMSFIQRAFTVSMDTEGRNRRAAFFNDNFTLEQAKDLVNQDRWGAGTGYMNPPSYIKSITYGRAVIINVVSNVSRSSVRQFLNAAYTQPGLSVEGTADLQNLQKNERYELQITTFGGSGQQVNKLVKVVNSREDVINNLNAYLRAPAPLTTMVPISYAAYSLRDDALTTLQRTTEYTVTEYSPQPMGQAVQLNLRFIVGGGDGAGDSGNEIFGTVRVNGRVVSSIDRNAATGNRRESGQNLDLPNSASPSLPIQIEWYNGDPEPVIEADFWEADEGSGDDRLFTRRFTLPMGGLARSDNASHAESYYERDQGAISSLRIDMTKTGNL
jgi:Thiol-activated cytolysin